jgi:hypothetical protein
MSQSTPVGAGCPYPILRRLLGGWSGSGSGGCGSGSGGGLFGAGFGGAGGGRAVVGVVDACRLSAGF